MPVCKLSFTKGLGDLLHPPTHFLVFHPTHWGFVQLLRQVVAAQLAFKGVRVKV